MIEGASILSPDLVRELDANEGGAMRSFATFSLIGFWCGLSVTLCGSAALAEGPAWKIGGLLCLTGPCAADGMAARAGMKLAVDDLNQRGGILGRRVEMVVEDTQEAISGARGVTAYRKLLTSPDIRFIVGPSWTPAGLSVAPIAAREQRVVLVSPSLGGAEFHRAGKNIFNFHGADVDGVKATAQYAFNNGFRRIAVFSSQHAWDEEQGRAFAAEFKRLGGVVPTIVEPLPDASDLRTEAMTVVRAKPDGIFFSIFAQLPIAAREIATLNFTGGKFHALLTQAVVDESKGNLEGIIFPGFRRPSDDLLKRFNSENPGGQDTSAAFSYDAVMYYAAAIEQNKTDSVDSVSNFLLQSKHTGASGVLEVDSEGCAHRELIQWVVKSGRISPISKP